MTIRHSISGLVNTYHQAIADGWQIFNTPTPGSSPFKLQLMRKQDMVWGHLEEEKPERKTIKCGGERWGCKHSTGHNTPSHNTSRRSISAAHVCVCISLPIFLVFSFSVHLLSYPSHKHLSWLISSLRLLFKVLCHISHMCLTKHWLKTSFQVIHQSHNVNSKTTSGFLITRQ